MLASARFRLVITMALVIMVGFGLIVPALPRFTRRFGVGEAGIGIVVFAFSLTRLIADLFVGRLIERFGERAVTAWGAAIVGVSSVAAGASQTFAQLVVLRGVGGFGSAFFLGGLMAYLIGTTPAAERGRAMSVFQASFGVGFLIGPALGGLMLAVAEPNVPLYVYGAVLLACVPLCLRALAPATAARALDDGATPIEPGPAMSENPPGPLRAPALSRLRPLLRSKTYRAALGASALMFLLGQAQFTIVPDFWERALGQDKATSGLPFTIASLLGLVVVWHAGSLTDRRGRRATLLPALALTAIGTAAMGVWETGIGFLVLMAVTGAAGGYMRPAPGAMVGDVAEPHERALAVSGFRMAGDAGALVGPIVVGPLAQYVSYTAAFFALAAITALVFVMALAADETAPRRRS